MKRADTCPGCGTPLLWEVSKQRGKCRECHERELAELMKPVKSPKKL
jgi:hypothetical protein